jgi:hypothetical protein
MGAITLSASAENMSAGFAWKSFQKVMNAMII